MSTTPSPSRSAVSIESARRPASGSGTTSPVSGSSGRPSSARRRAVRGLGVAHDVAVDDDLDRVTLVLVEFRGVGDIDHLAIDADADEALAPGAIEDPVALGLAILDERPQDEETSPFRKGQHLVHDLLDRLALDGVAVGAMRDPDPREQQAQVVVDLGDRADRRARVARGALLLDRDGGGQPVDRSTSGFSICPRNWRA